MPNVDVKKSEKLEVTRPAPIRKIDNPFGAPQLQSVGVERVEEERATQEVQAGMVIAHKFPRNVNVVMDRILQSCTRVTLAAQAMYAYPRGGKTVTGPSIRLAEAIAQEWGNMHFGVAELNASPFETTVQAYAWDLERNVKQTKTFSIKNARWTRADGFTELEDPRDRYENIANQAARRMRSCILSIIPRDVIDAAMDQCRETLENQMGAPEDEIERMVNAFAEFDVTQEMIAKRLGHHLNATIAAEIIQLRNIYASIRDGMAVVGDFFEQTDNATQLKKELDDKKNMAEKTTKATKRGRPEKQSKTSPLSDFHDDAAMTFDELLRAMKTADTTDKVNELIAFADNWSLKEKNAVKGAAEDAKRRIEDAEKS